MVRLRVCPAVPIITRSVVVLPVRELDHETLPGRIVITLAGVFGAGESVVTSQSFVLLSVRELDHEALPGGIVIPLAGVLRAGEAISRRQLE